MNLLRIKGNYKCVERNGVPYGILGITSSDTSSYKDT